MSSSTSSSSSSSASNYSLRANANFNSLNGGSNNFKINSVSIIDSDFFSLDQISNLNDSSLVNSEEDNFFITDEEKKEYQANKSLYLTERLNRRELLKQKFQDLKLNSSFKLRPRNFS